MVSWGWPLGSDTEVSVGGPLTVEFGIEGDVTGPYQVYLVNDRSSGEVCVIICCSS